MKLSIIVPVYNMADGKLQYCLESLLQQEVDDYEIIAVDDASTDRSPLVLKEYAEKYPERIRIILSPENQRQGGAKNKGIEVAQGDFIGFVDSDDWVHPKMYQELLKKAEETGADLVGCDYSIVTKEGLEFGNIRENNTEDQCGELDVNKHRLHLLKTGAMWAKIYKRSVLIENDLRFPEHIFYEDNYAAHVWSLYFTKYAHVKEPYYYYREVASSTTHYVTWQRCLDRMSAAEKMIADCKRRGLYEAYREELDYRFIQTFYLVTLYSYMLQGKKKQIKNVKFLQKEMQRLLPDFEQNAYYLEKVTKEEKKMLHLHQKNNLLFYMYFRLLYGYRKLRNKRT